MRLLSKWSRPARLDQPIGNDSTARQKAVAILVEFKDRIFERTTTADQRGRVVVELHDRDARVAHARESKPRTPPRSRIASGSNPEDVLGNRHELEAARPHDLLEVLNHALTHGPSMPPCWFPASLRRASVHA